MVYVNVGVAMVADRSPIPTKKALQQLLAVEPSEVLFFNTGLPLGPGKAEYRGSELDPQYTYQVTGPDPYTNRKWFASVKIRSDSPIVIA
jgi:hypothetical protein